MKKILLVLALILLGSSSFAQINEGLIEMGKYYRQFMFRNSPPASVLKDFEKYNNTELENTANFIKEALTNDNNLMTEKFLIRPDNKDLKYIYIVEHINYNVRKDNPEDNDQLIKELNDKDISDNELVDTYYSMLFDGYGNKIKPYDLSGVNFELNKYGLKNDTEKGIFFLQSMNFNGTTIWGYINIPKPPRYEKAFELISRFPKYNGSLYYQYLDLSFPDFKISIELDKKPQSYKEYYINKYYETLLNHLSCLNALNHSKDEIYDLILGSILKESNYYKYSKKEGELKKLLSVYKK